MAEHRQKAQEPSPDGVRTGTDRLTAFASAALVAAGADVGEADIVARILVWADRVGRPTQGVWRLPIIVRRLEGGLLQSPCEPEFCATSPTSVAVDGRNGLGHFVAYRAACHAVNIASENAICLVGVRNSNFLGPVGFYANLAAEAGMIGFAMSNSYPKVAPFGGRSPALGTNPLAFAAPRANGPPLLLDMSTAESSGSAVRRGDEEQARGQSTAERGARRPPTGPTGRDVLRPFGGAKGFGLGLMVDVLAGALTGAGVAHEVRSMYHDFERGGNNGHLFIVLNVDAVTSRSAYYESMERLIGAVEATTPAGAGDSVRIPGRARWDALSRSDGEGIPIAEDVAECLTELGLRLEVSLPW